MLQEHTGRVFRLQFDEFQIVSSSHDDTIIIWDFLNPEQPEIEATFNDTFAKLTNHSNLSSNSSTSNGFNTNNIQTNNTTNSNNNKTQFNTWLPSILNVTNSSSSTRRPETNSPNQSPTIQHNRNSLQRKNQNSSPSTRMEMEGDE